MGCLKYCCIAIAVSLSTIAQAADFRTPAKPFAAMAKPPAPDYQNRAAWLVWPGRESKADAIPQGIDGAPAQNPQVDVFFIHPTTYLTNAAWNAPFDEGGPTAAQLENGVLPYQISAFNGCCRIYAPRYRQATISTFLKPGPSSFAAFDLAYGDVLRAFDHYLAEENGGRPFMIASHSQGSLHATRLLRERVVGNGDLRRRLVAAYVVGASLPEREAPLPVCRTARQTGCMVDWNSTTARTFLALGRGIMITYNAGRYKRVGQDRWLCVNPLTWTLGGDAPASANLGALPNLMPGETSATARPGVTGARCERGRVVVAIAPDKRRGFIDPLTKLGSYHNHDYNLFYASVRQNAIDRASAYLGTR